MFKVCEKKAMHEFSKFKGGDSTLKFTIIQKHFYNLSKQNKITKSETLYFLFIVHKN